MGVLYDVVSSVTASASTAVTTWQHSATTANVVGVAVGFMRGANAADTITNVSYGGTTLVQVIRATAASGEAGAAEWWMPASPIIPPQGTQTVAYSSTARASSVFGVAVTFTGKHPAYPIGSGVFSAGGLTSSFSANITTGYVVGYGLGGVFTGLADPVSISFDNDRTLLAKWDQGARGVIGFRHTDPTTAGTGPTVEFGAAGSVDDDIAFAAIFVTDGAILPGVGAAVAAGLAPTVIDLSVGTEATASPGVGAVQTVGQIPVVEGFVFPGVGATQTVGQIPDEYRELNQGVGLGALVTSGQAPQSLRDGSIGPLQGLCLAGGLAPALVTELAQNIGLGSAVIAGQAPSEYRELSQAVGLGSAVIGGLGPACLPENGIGPAQGLCSLGGLAPSLYLERLITPEVVPVAVIEGRAPVVDTGGLVVEATITPDTALLTLDGRTPDEAVEYDKPRGHVTVRRRHRRNYGFELSAMPEAVVTTVAPVPAAALETPEIVDPPSEPIAALDTVAAEARIKTLETRRSRAARMRREEEELIAILMRAA